MDSYHTVIVILGMVYNWVYHVEPIVMHQQQERLNNNKATMFYFICENQEKYPLVI